MYHSKGSNVERDEQHHLKHCGNVASVVNHDYNENIILVQKIIVLS